MGKVDLSHLSEEECQRILEVIQRDFNVRQREKDRIEVQQEELVKEDMKTDILSQNHGFNENCCIRCCQQFGFFFNRKRLCAGCKFNMCKNCSVYDASKKEYVCKACWQQRETSRQSCDWFYAGGAKKKKRFGSDKVVKTLVKRQDRRQSMPALASIPNNMRAREWMSDSTDVREIDCRDRSSSLWSIAESDNESLYEEMPDRKRPTLIGLVHQMRRLSEPAIRAYDLNSEISSVGRGSIWGGDGGVGGLDGLSDQGLNEPLKQFDDSLHLIMNELHSLIRSDEQLLQSEVLDPEHSVFTDCKDQIYQELISLSKHISKAMMEMSDSEDDCEEFEQTNQSKIRVRRYLIQKVEHITKTRLKHLLPDEDEEMTVDWTRGTDHEDADEHYLEEQLSLVVLKKVLEDYNRKYDTTDGMDVSPSLSPLTLPICEQVIQEVSSDESPESLDLKPGKPFRMSPQRSSSFKLKEPSSDSEFLDSDVTLPSFGSDRERKRDVNLQIVSLMKGPSPLPSFQQTASPIGRLEMDLDDLSSLQRFVYYSEEEPETEIDEWGRSSCRPETFLLKGDDGMKVWTPSVDEKLQIQSLNVAVPPLDARYSPMVGDRNIDDLSDLSSASEGDESDIGDMSDSDASTISTESHDKQPGPRKSVSEGVQTDPQITEMDCSFNHVEVSRLDPDQPAEVSRLDPESVTEVETSNGNEISLQVGLQIPNVSRENLEFPVSAGIDTDASILPLNRGDTLAEGECSDPRFVTSSCDVTVVRGEQVTLTCEVEGTQPIDTFWFRESEVESALCDNEKYEISRLRDTCTITIHAADNKDKGVYICIAVNDEGQSSQMVRLGLTPNPLEIKAAEFLKSISDLELYEGQCAKFNIKVKGYPPPRIVWYKDGVLLKNSAEFVMEKQGNRGYSLSIYSLTQDDDAEYTCVAVNVTGRVQCSAQLLVEARPTEESGISRPTRNGDHLEELSRRVSLTRDNVESTAQDVLHSADMIISMNRDLDNFDQNLTSLEQEQFIDDERQKRQSAANVRKTTESSLAVVNQTNHTLSRSESSEQKSKLSRQKPIQGKNSDYAVTKSWKSQDSETRLKKSKPTLNNLNKNDIKARNGAAPPVDEPRDKDLHSLNVDNETKIQNSFSMNSDYRREDSDRHSRDYYTEKQEEKKDKRKVSVARGHSNVQRGVNDVEERIYLTAGKAFSLEEKIQMLSEESHKVNSATPRTRMERIENEVARTVAQVEQSEKEVKAIESDVHLMQKMVSNDSLHSQLSIVSEDSGMCSGSPSTPTGDQLSPSTPTGDQLSPSTPTGDQLSQLSSEEFVPLHGAVNKLKSMFDCPANSNNGRGNFTRVHSLTGRDFKRFADKRAQYRALTLKTTSDLHSTSTPKPPSHYLHQYTVKISSKPESETELTDINFHIDKNNLKSPERKCLNFGALREKFERDTT